MIFVVLVAALALSGCLSVSYTNAPQTWQCGGTGDYCDSPKVFVRVEIPT